MSEADRRDPTHPDRRQRLPRAGGRRANDAEPDHGTRARYQQGCPCTPCRAANAAYMSDLRKRRAKGAPILGVLVNAAEAWRRIRQLRGEDFPHRRITGWTDRHLPIRHYTPELRVRLSTVVRLRRLHQYHLFEESAPASD